MRRLFIIRKDLNLSPGKLAAMCSHCAEEYFMNLIRNGMKKREDLYHIDFELPEDIIDDYINSSYVKTICEAKNLAHLNKAAEKAASMGFVEGQDYGFINDLCLTELKPENADGTCTVGIWFRPIDDQISKEISKKYQLYRS